MSAAPVSFLQSGDFRLDDPLTGLESLPEKLRQIVIEAPLAAASRVFDAALAQRIDFVVLTGNLCNLHAPDPRSLAFLREQFTRLTDSGIEIYLAGGPSDPPELWPAALPLPEGVRWFSSEAVDTFYHRGGGEPLAALCGQSLRGNAFKPAEFERPADAPLALAVAHAEARPQLLTARKFDYWALGGHAAPATLAQAPAAIHYAGAPQGMRPGEHGPGGCTVVRLDGLDGARLERIETDVVRYLPLAIAAPAGSSSDDLEMLLFERFAELADTAASRHLLVSLAISAEDTLAAALHTGGALEQLLADLREEFGSRDPAVWPVTIQAAPPAEYPSVWLEEDSVLGEYLRTLQAWQRNPNGNTEAVPDFSALVPADDAWRALAELNLLDPPQRQAVLAEATALGAALLSGNHTEA